MINILSRLKTNFFQDNLTKIFILMLILILIMFYKNKYTIENFNNQCNYTCLSNDNVFNNNNYIKFYDNIILDNNKNQYYLKSIFDNTNVIDNGIVVNVGCKTGNINKLLQQKNINNIGLDRSKNIINYCKNNNPDTEYDIFSSDTLENIAFKYNQPITHILCLDMEIYYIDNLNLFFSQAYNLLCDNGYIIIHAVDLKKYNNTSVYSRINNFNPNNLSIKKVNDSGIKFNDSICTTKYRIFPNDSGVIQFTETIENLNDNSVHENIHNINYLSCSDIENIARTNGFKKVDKLDIELEYYNNEYLYIFKK